MILRGFTFKHDMQKSAEFSAKLKSDILFAQKVYETLNCCSILRRNGDGKEYVASKGENAKILMEVMEVSANPFIEHEKFHTSVADEINELGWMLVHSPEISSITSGAEIPLVVPQELIMPEPELEVEGASGEDSVESVFSEEVLENDEPAIKPES